MRVPKVCRYCQRTTKERPCEHCGKPEAKDTAEAYRKSSSERGYGGKWKTWRAAILKRLRATGEWGGNCDRCGRVILKSVHCDHIEPVSGADDPRFYDRTNIQFLHAGCHSEKTIEDRKSGKTRKA